MPKAIRYASGGKFLDNSLFWTAGDFIGGSSPDPNIAALEEQMTIESHKQDFAIAFGIPAESITVVDVPYFGDPADLPTEGESDHLMRLPVDPPPPEAPTLLDILLADVNLSPATKAAIETLKG